MTNLSGSTVGEVSYFKDTRPNGTDGGTYPDFPAWYTRIINTTVFNLIPGCSVDANVVTLPAGKYDIRFSMMTRVTDFTETRLWNNTTSSVIAHANAGYCWKAEYYVMKTQAEFATETEFICQMRGSRGGVDNAKYQGDPAWVGHTESFLELVIMKL